jgi:hypothetical protein
MDLVNQGANLLQSWGLEKSINRYETIQRGLSTGDTQIQRVQDVITNTGEAAYRHG